MKQPKKIIGGKVKMKVFVNGKIEASKVGDLVSEILYNMSERLSIPEDTGMAIEGLEFKVRYNIGGQETYATVSRDINGEKVNEIFMVAVHLDKDGNVVQADDNEAQSFYDGYTLAQSVGLDYQYTGIESKYRNEDLELLESLGENIGTEPMSVRYRVKNSPEIEVVRHFKGDLLVAEYDYEPKITE